MSGVLDALAEAARALPLSLAALALVAAVALIALIALLFRAGREATAVAVDPPAPGSGIQVVDFRAVLPSPALARGFRRAVAYVLRQGPGGRYRVPWILSLGEAGAGKSTVLARNGLGLPYGEPAGALAGGPAEECRWWLYERAAVLDVAGDLVLRADGRTADEPAWRSLLALLARSRPRRPADGVVLTVPATALLPPPAPPPGTEAPDPRAVLADRARRLQAKLAALQDAVGMRLPVTLLVTKCDLLDGFTAFSEELDAAGRRQMFGWANPAAVDAPFASSWVDDAFASIGRALAAAAPPPETPRVAGPDDFFDGGAVAVAAAPARPETAAAERVAAAIAALREPLRIVANQLFSEVPDLEPFPWRGVYFAGGRRFGAHPDGRGLAQDRPDWATGADAHGTGVPAAVDFLADLFDLKVFYEWSLARPTVSAARRARRRRLAWQGVAAALALTATVGFAWASRRVTEDAALLSPWLDQGAAALEKLGRAQDAPETTRRTLLAEEGRELVAGAAAVPSYRLRAAALPASWFGAGDTTAAVAGLYGRVIYAGLAGDLTSDLEGLAGGPAAAQPASRPIYSVADSPQYGRLLRWLGDLGDFDRDAGRYACLASACSGSGARLADDLDRLTRARWDQPLAPPTAAATRFTRAALRRARGEAIEPDAQDDRLAAAATAAATDLHVDLFRSNQLSRDLDELTARLALLGQVPTAAAEADAYYRALKDSIDRTQATLARRDVAWAAGPGFAPGPPYDRLLALTGSSPHLGPPTADEIAADGRQRFAEFRKGLAAYSTSYTGTVLAVEDGEAKLALAQSVLDLQRALADLLGQSFMDPRDPVGLQPDPPAGTYLTWDVPSLERAAALDTAYREFVAGGLTRFPASLQPAMQRAAVANLGTNMVREVAQAQRFPPLPDLFTAQLREAALAARIDNLQSAAPQLGDAILERFRTLGLTDAARSLGAVVEGQKDALLEQLDLLTGGLGLFYVPVAGGIESWDGTASLAWRAFGVADAAALADYLAAQREAIVRLGDRYGEPALTAVRTTDVTGVESTARFARWRLVVADVDDAANKVPANALATVEALISPTLAQVVVDGCLAALPAASQCFAEPTPAALRGDVCDPLLTAAGGLASASRTRCAELVDAQAAAGYGEIRDAFSLHLAGRLPFADLPAEPPPAEVSPGGLVAFFAVYDRHRSLLAQVPDGSPSFGAALPAVRAFLAQMDAVRAFFAPFLADPAKVVAPTWDVTAGFRVNRGAEAGADEIIGWTVTAGSQVADRHDAAPAFRWRAGTPVAVALRWASESPATPRAPLAEPTGTVDGRLVTWNYRNVWSLLSLLRAHATPPGEFPGGADPQPTTLRFVAPVGPAAGGAVSDARVYLRLTLATADDAKTAVTIPGFPTAMPSLPAPWPGGTVRVNDAPAAAEAPMDGAPKG